MLFANEESLEESLPKLHIDAYDQVCVILTNEEMKYCVFVRSRSKLHSADTTEEYHWMEAENFKEYFNLLRESFLVIMGNTQSIQCVKFLFLHPTN